MTQQKQTWYVQQLIVDPCWSITNARVFQHTSRFFRSPREVFREDIEFARYRHWLQDVRSVVKPWDSLNPLGRYDPAFYCNPDLSKSGNIYMETETTKSVWLNRVDFCFGDFGGIIRHSHKTIDCHIYSRYPMVYPWYPMILQAYAHQICWFHFLDVGNQNGSLVCNVIILQMHSDSLWIPLAFVYGAWPIYRCFMMIYLFDLAIFPSYFKQP